MKTFKKTILPVLLATIWISISEFVRNEFVFKSYWTDHYESLGLDFPDAPVNGAMWGVWSMLFAILIYILNKKFSLAGTTFVSWFAAFLLMWVVTWNLAVLPPGILWFAAPLSLLETFVAALIIRKLS